MSETPILIKIEILLKSIKIYIFIYIYYIQLRHKLTDFFIIDYQPSTVYLFSNLSESKLRHNKNMLKTHGMPSKTVSSGASISK